MQINREFVKPRLCPLCGVTIGKGLRMVEIRLNNNMMMPQPVCEKDYPQMQKIECQKEMLRVARLIWVDEIYENTHWTDAEKDTEVERIMALEVI